jgi:type I restriction enzyme S subunit
MTNIQSKVPLLRFPEYKGNWKRIELGNIGSFLNGLTYSPDNIRGEGLLVLRSSNVQGGSLAFKDNVYVNVEVKEELLSKLGDILICVRNGSKKLIGKNALITEECPKATHGAFMSVFRSEDSNFAFQLLQTEKYRRQVFVDLGATINSINGSNLKKYKFYLPESREAEEISTFLSIVDKKISLLKQKHEQLVQYKKGVMQQLFSQQLRFKDCDGLDFPDWASAQLKSILLLQSNPIDMQDDEEYELITAKRRNGGIVSRGKYLGKEVLVKSQFQLKENQFVISKRQIVHGACGLVPKYLEGAILSNEYNVFEGAPDVLDIHYFNLFSKTLEMKKSYFRSSDGVHIEKLLFRTKDWLKTRIQLPSLDEQKRIVSFSIELEKKIGLIQKQIEQTQAYKQGLLQQMFV